jgi:hypothetical protein
MQHASLFQLIGAGDLVCEAVDIGFLVLAALIEIVVDQLDF